MLTDPLLNSYLKNTLRVEGWQEKSWEYTCVTFTRTDRSASPRALLVASPSEVIRSRHNVYVYIRCKCDNRVNLQGTSNIAGLHYNIIMLCLHYNITYYVMPIGKTYEFTKGEYHLKLKFDGGIHLMCTSLFHFIWHKEYRSTRTSNVKFRINPRSQSILTTLCSSNATDCGPQFKPLGA